MIFCTYYYCNDIFELYSNGNYFYIELINLVLFSDHVFELFMYIPNTNLYDRTSAKIGSVMVLEEAVRKSGKRPMVINITVSKKVHKDNDAYRR